MDPLPFPQDESRCYISWINSEDHFSLFSKKIEEGPGRGKGGDGLPAPSATQADISLSALQTATIIENNIPTDILVTIPPLGSLTLGFSTPNVTTQPGSCSSNTDCVGYTLIVPASNPSFGTFPITNYSVPSGSSINYTVNAQAFTIPTNPNPGVPDCSSSSLKAAVTVQTGLATNQDFSFTGCQ